MAGAAYANMLSLTVEGDDLKNLNKLCARHFHVVPDAWLRKLIAEANEKPDDDGLP